jgi:hypothetical protein
MATRSLRQRFTSWTAVLAVLLASLAPTLSLALGAANSATWVEICTTQGSKWVATGEDGSGHAPASIHPLEHCPYCSLHTPTLGLPPLTGVQPLPVRLSHAVPVAFLAAPRTLHAWLSAQPRGPPRLS